jgi:hypothetical protein
MMLESSNLPLRLERYDGPPPSALWLAGREGAVVVLPLGENDTRAMLDGLAHLRPLVNGDSGFLPRPLDRAMELLAHGVDGEAERFLRAVGVTHVVSRDAQPLPEAAAFAEDRVYGVPGGEPARLVTAGEPVATRFTADGTVLVLREPAIVSRVVFELADAEWVARPSVEASLDGVTWEPLGATASLADATLSLYRDPTHGRGEIRFEARTLRALRLDPRLPARPGAFEVGR